MALTLGTRLGPHEDLALLGAGDMGEVLPTNNANATPPETRRATPP